MTRPSDESTAARPRPTPQSHDLADTGWTLRSCRAGFGPEIAAEASRAGASPAGWLPATVPGLATQDLLAAGRIPDPYFGDQGAAALFIEEQDFVYLRRVILRPEDLEGCPRARLVFDSLDTFATVFVNGREVARHENQFRRSFVDVTEALVPGDNWIAVAFDASWPATVRRAGPPLPHWNPPAERLYVRKSQMSFGWDWARRVPTVGIAGGVRLELSRGVFSDDLWLQGQLVGESGGLLTAETEYTPHESFDAEIALFVDGEECLREHVTFHAGHPHRVNLSHTLMVARRWEPRERGVPHLYDVELRVTRQGEVIHRLDGRVGIRSVELDLGTPGEPRFRIVVNGEPLFVKGENWIPMDLLHTRPSDAELVRYLELLIAGGVNFLRVWGGGIIERPAFYRACDELGLLVWQEFPYACGVYPAHEAFVEEARREAEDIVKRLRSHTCLALWCGNNENEVLAERYLPELRRHPIHHQVLPEVVAQLDPLRPYWPGSPGSVSPEEPADSPREGDRHNWDAWNGWQGTEFIDDRALFCSEFGFQALPQRETLETCLPLDDLWTPGQVSAPAGPSPGALLARHGAQLDKLFSRSSEYAYPRDLDSFIAATQALQADTIARTVLHYRRSGSGGVIVWNYTSAWPSACWALIDWYRRPKQAYYAARRAFEPLTLGIEPVDASAEVYAAYLTLDRRAACAGRVELTLRALDSGEEHEQVTALVSFEGPGAVEAVRFELPVDCARERFALVATFHPTTTRGLGEVRELRDVRYLAPLRTLERRPRALRAESSAGSETSRSAERPTLTAEWRGDAVHLVSEAWHLRVGIESYEAPVLWDDNYIDLLPGEQRTLRLTRGQPEHLWLVANFGERRRLQRNRVVSL